MSGPHPIPHSFPFDPRYGHSVEDLQQIQAPDTEPSDFAAFWRKLHRQALTVPLDLKVEPRPSPCKGQNLLQVSYRVWPDYRVGAWVLLPEKTTSPACGVVAGHGYGGREEPDTALAGPDRAVIFPVAPGFHISPDPHLPYNNAGMHVVHGIEQKEHYLLAACAAALWRAVDVLEEICNGSIEHFHYRGWSFGGGMGALMLPWEPRFQTAELGQVTFAHHPFRLRHPCVGSGQAVREYWLKDPSIEKTTLPYFEACSSLRHLHIPTVFACSVFDPAVPPPGQWAAANAHPGPKRITPLPTGHFDYPHPDTPSAEQLHQQHLQELFG
ncbi:MAG: acetylxylan esterase [Kiritimatiellia bacterium]